jgi:DNA-binding winged helix-turn-helix (wHTH) protein
MGNGEVFHFGAFTLEAAERRLTLGRNVIRLSPKAHDVLVVLLRHARRLVTKDELLSHVWPDASVEEGILTVHISALRKAFGDDKRSCGYIETVSRAGYRFIARSPASRSTTTRCRCVPPATTCGAERARGTWVRPGAFGVVLRVVRGGRHVSSGEITYLRWTA